MLQNYDNRATAAVFPRECRPSSTVTWQLRGKAGAAPCRLGYGAPITVAGSALGALPAPKPLPYPLVRMTWISRSRIFLRSVLRFTPSRSAARI